MPKKAYVGVTTSIPVKEESPIWKTKQFDWSSLNDLFRTDEYYANWYATFDDISPYYYAPTSSHDVTQRHRLIATQQLNNVVIEYNYVTEQNYDKLYISAEGAHYVEGNIVNWVSGQGSGRIVLNMPEGASLYFAYQKDDSGSAENEEVTIRFISYDENLKDVNITSNNYTEYFDMTPTNIYPWSFSGDEIYLHTSYNTGTYSGNATVSFIAKQDMPKFSFIAYANYESYSGALEILKNGSVINSGSNMNTIIVCPLKKGDSLSFRGTYDRDFSDVECYITRLYAYIEPQSSVKDYVVKDVAREIKQGYIGVPTYIDQYSDETITTTLDSSTVSEYFKMYQGNERWFEFNGNTLSPISSHLRQTNTTLVAVRDITSLKCTCHVVTTNTLSIGYNSDNLFVTPSHLKDTYADIVTEANDEYVINDIKTGDVIHLDCFHSGWSDDTIEIQLSVTAKVKTSTQRKNVARKIKKAYVGLGGVARPSWNYDKLSYYGVIGVAKTSNTTNIVTGGITSSYGAWMISGTAITVVDDNLTINNSVVDSTTSGGGASWGNKTAVGGSSNTPYYDVYQGLTRTSNTLDFSGYGSTNRMISFKDCLYAYDYTENVDDYSEDYTEIGYVKVNENLTRTNLGVTCNPRCIAKTEDYIINLSYEEVDNVAMDENGTICRIPTLLQNYSFGPSSYSHPRYAMFGGGMITTDNYQYPAPYHSMNFMECWNNDLTHYILEEDVNLSPFGDRISNYSPGGGVIADNIIVMFDAAITSSSTNPYIGASNYDANTLTRQDLTPPRKNVRGRSRAVTGNYILFSGDCGYGTYSTLSYTYSRSDSGVVIEAYTTN